MSCLGPAGPTTWRIVAQAIGAEHQRRLLGTCGLAAAKQRNVARQASLSAIIVDAINRRLPIRSRSGARNAGSDVASPADRDEPQRQIDSLVGKRHLAAALRIKRDRRDVR